jgi:adenylate kinase
MFVEQIKSADFKNGFILDGYPRNLAQAKTLDEILKQRKDRIYVIYLDTCEAVIIQRLSGRRICSVCGANYHLKNMPPKRDMLCDKCGGELIQRTDDREETIKNRLAVYLKSTASLIDYYERQKKLYRISGNDEAGIVLNKIINLVSVEDR